METENFDISTLENNSTRIKQLEDGISSSSAQDRELPNENKVEHVNQRQPGKLIQGESESAAQTNTLLGTSDLSGNSDTDTVSRIICTSMLFFVFVFCFFHLFL